MRKKALDVTFSVGQIRFIGNMNTNYCIRKYKLLLTLEKATHNAYRGYTSIFEQQLKLEIDLYFNITLSSYVENSSKNVVNEPLLNT